MDALVVPHDCLNIYLCFIIPHFWGYFARFWSFSRESPIQMRGWIWSRSIIKIPAILSTLIPLGRNGQIRYQHLLFEVQYGAVQRQNYLIRFLQKKYAQSSNDWQAQYHHRTPLPAVFLGSHWHNNQTTGSLSFLFFFFSFLFRIWIIIARSNLCRRYIPLSDVHTVWINVKFEEDVVDEVLDSHLKNFITIQGEYEGAVGGVLNWIALKWWMKNKKK